jgi:predicted DNA-binding protein (MmcQ/YjbR family)
MNIETFREYCLSLGGAKEKLPFKKRLQELLVFYVTDKWFCFFNVEKFDFCDLKCDPLKKSYQLVAAGVSKKSK